MAITAVVTLTDDFNRITRKRVEMEATVLATAQTDMSAFIPLLEAITDLGVVAITYSLYDASEASSPASGANVDVGATFRLRKADGGVVSYKVPGFDQSKADGAGNIDPADTDVVSFFDQFKSAGAFTLSDGEVITAVLSGQLDA